MKRNLKKLGCAMLCACLLMINIPGSMSYAENAEQTATETDATETGSAATGTDAELTGEIELFSAAPEDVLYASGATLEIASQDEWDALFTQGMMDNWWMVVSAGKEVVYIGTADYITISLNSDIALSDDISFLSAGLNDAAAQHFLFYGNGHSIEANGHEFRLSANKVTVDNVHIKNGTLAVGGIYSGFQCTDSTFTSASIEVSAQSDTERTYITGCSFYDCSGPCVNLKAAPCPVSISDCAMNECGRVFQSANVCRVSFSGITAENCTETVIGQTGINGYIIESISGCELSTSQTGITAIDHQDNAVGEITDCTITGFDTGIMLRGGNAPDIDTITIRDTTITDCITGLHTISLSGYDNAVISNLTIEAREGVAGTTGYKGYGSLTSKTFASTDVNYDFSKMPQIKDCRISGFDLGIDLESGCNAVVSNCEISDCISGVSISSSIAAIVDTTMTASAAAAQSSVGVTTNLICYLIDCDINGFYYGSDCSSSGNATIIGCRYKNRYTNLITATQTEVYNTSFAGGEAAVTMRGGTSWFYDCVIEGDDTTQSGFFANSGEYLRIYSSERPYEKPQTSYYDNVKQYSDRTVTDGKSEISNCGTGVNTTCTLGIADTYIHDCKTGINGSSIYSYGNNLIEDCTDGMVTQTLFKNITAGNVQADTHADTIRNCSNDGLNSAVITSNPAEWKNRLEIYNCGNYGIKARGDLRSVTVDVHDCKTGLYVTTTANIYLTSESKLYDNNEWNVYAPAPFLAITGTEGTLIGGGTGNVYSEYPQPVINVQDLHSDDSVYYLGADNTMYIFSVDNIDGTVVFDAPDTGYVSGRRVAGLIKDVTSQMFAKKEGWIITTEMDGNNTYAVFATGCDVTYDVTTNGGDTFSGGDLTKISYLSGRDYVDLTYNASKTGYEFVGWNTDPDATEGLDTTILAGEEDITLYAIYKKDCYVTYHTYDAAHDYRAALTFYNNQEQEAYALAAYNAGGDNTFVGYVLDEDAVVSSAADVLTADDDITATPDGLDVYCVYEKQGRLDYLNKDGTIQNTERSTVYQVMSNNKEFVYTVKAGEPVEGFTFTGWKDKDGRSYAAGSTISTENTVVALTPVYKVNDEPATEEPTDTPTTENPADTPTTENPPDTPTTENPADTPTTENPPDAPTTENPPDTPTTENPPDTPTTENPAETSTTQAPTAQAPTTTSTTSGPNTGDSTNPICVIGLGILSLLGILGLYMKNKRKAT